MKGILKLFPVAVAAFALASCSSDDLLKLDEASAQAVNLEKGQILVTVDEPAQTRAAFGEWTNKNDNYIYRSIYWTPGDQLKLYDDKNWRPQTYDYSSEATTKFVPNSDYVNSAVFTLSEESIQEDDGQYENGYAMYPASLGVFGGELRSEIFFSFSRMAGIVAEKVEATESKATEAGVTAWKTAMPMWGNITDKKLGLKRLTGFLRLDLKDMNITADRTYIVVESDQQLVGSFVANDFDYTAKAAPVLVGNEVSDYAGFLAATALVHTPANIDYDTNPMTKLDIFQAGGNNNGNNVMVIELPKVTTAENFFYVPIPIGVHTLRITMIPNFDVDVPATVAMPAAANLGNIFGGTAGETFNVEEATFYRIDRGEEGTAGTPVTPEQLKQWIKDYDAIGSNMSFTVNAPIKVKNNDVASTQNYILDLSDYQLKNKITVNLAGGIIESSDATGNTILTVKTKAGSEALTLNIAGEGAGTPIDKLVLGEDVKSPVIIGGLATDLAPNEVEISNNFVTWKASAGLINLTGKLTIDAADKIITDLNCKGTNDEIALNNGTITNLNHNQKGVSVNSKGQSFIKTIRALTTAGTWQGWNPTYTAPVAGVYEATEAKNYNNVTLKSVWDGTKSVIGVKNITAQQAAIHTAAQFSAGGYAANSKLFTEMNITGPWVGNALTQNFDGNDKAITLNITLNAPQVTGNPVVGLFGAITPAANLTVENVKMNAKINLANVVYTASTYYTGALAGQVQEGGAFIVTFDNISINADNASNVIGFANSNVRVNGNIGGMIGLVNEDVVIKNSTVKGKIQGFENLGGLVGYIAAQKKLTLGSASQADSFEPNTVNVSFTELYPFSSDKSSKLAGTIGSFVGSIASHATNGGALDIYPGYTVTDNISANIAALKFDKNYYDNGVIPVATNYYYTGSKAGADKNLVGYLDETSVSEGTVTTKRVGTTGAIDPVLDRVWTNAKNGGSDFIYNIFKAQQ